MKFDTTRYQASHAKQPRGFGRWAFSASRPRCAEHAEAVFFTGSYAEAKKQAASYFRTLNYDLVSVLG